MTHCERCGGELGWNQGLVKLIGGLVCRLCTSCNRAWHVYVHALAEWEETLDIDAHIRCLEALAVAGDPPSGMAWRQALRQKDAINQQLFALGQQWLQGVSEQGTHAEKVV